MWGTHMEGWKLIEGSFSKFSTAYDVAIPICLSALSLAVIRALKKGSFEGVLCAPEWSQF